MLCRTAEKSSYIFLEKLTDDLYDQPLVTTDLMQTKE